MVAKASKSAPAPPTRAGSTTPGVALEPARAASLLRTWLSRNCVVCTEPKPLWTAFCDRCWDGSGQ